MTETTPLLQQNNDISRYNAAASVEGNIFKKGKNVEPLVYEAESEVSVHAIVTAIFSEWKENGANESFTPQDIMAMHMQYSQITKGREVIHAHHEIINELTDAMLLHLRHTHIHICDPCSVHRRFNILRNLQENWSSIISFDESLARSLNVSHSPAYRERFQNVWKSCQHKYALLENSMSDFTCQLLLCIILLSWPLSVMIIAAQFESECTMNSFLPDAMVAVGVLGTMALLMRLLLASIEECYWNRVRRVMTMLWTALKLVEFVFLLALTAQIRLDFVFHFSSLVLGRSAPVLRLAAMADDGTMMLIDDAPGVSPADLPLPPVAAEFSIPPEEDLHVRCRQLQGFQANLTICRSKVTQSQALLKVTSDPDDRKSIQNLLVKFETDLAAAQEREEIVEP